MVKGSLGEIHIPPHKVWANIHSETKFSSDEENHLQECEVCSYMFMLCLNSSSFGAVLKETEEGQGKVTAND